MFPAAAFYLDNLQGTVVWNTVKGLSLEFKDILIENADAAVKLNGTYTNADGTPFGTADLKADVLRGNVPAVWKYMPLIVGNDTITWLRYGLLEGKATGGQVLLKGPLHDFPFKESKEHQFLAAVNVEDVLLDVYPNILDNPKVTAKRGAIWPLFEKVGGVVKFEGDGMAITADRGTYKGVQLTRAQVDIPAFSPPPFGSMWTLPPPVRFPDSFPTSKPPRLTVIPAVYLRKPKDPAAEIWACS